MSNQTPVPDPIELRRARELAAQAWCEPSTSRFVMQPELCEAFAQILARYTGQITQLADFILSEILGEPSQNQGAVETAIRLLREARPTPTTAAQGVDNREAGDLPSHMLAFTDEPMHRQRDDLARAVLAQNEEIRSLREEVTRLKARADLAERLANGIAHMDQCMECGDGSAANCPWGGQEADKALKEYNALIPELNCHGLGEGGHKGATPGKEAGKP